ncbi:MAG: M3 family oligoendopeptidase [Phycisphaerae bacterium]
MLEASRLGRFRERKFLDENVDFSDAAAVKKWFEKLLAVEVGDESSFRNWLDAKAELCSAVDQYGSVLYINLTCHTEDEQISVAFENFTKNVHPILIEYDNRVDARFLELLEKYPLPAGEIALLEKCCRKDVEMFREENVALLTKDSLLVQKYEKLAGSMMVDDAGEQKTFQQMAKYQYETDRSQRKRGWLACAQRRYDEKDAHEALYGDMVRLRSEIAANAGFDNYLEYGFPRKHRFDYTPQDCKSYHKAAEELIVPLLGKLYEMRKSELGVDKLRPWDLLVDTQGRAPLAPFDDVSKLPEKAHEVFSKLSPKLAELFGCMMDNELFDLESRKGKAPGGYQSTLAEAGLPFIFANFVGLDDDLRVMFHESGHAFHTFAAREQSLYEYRHGPMEFCEVASMSMELFVLPFMDVIYPSAADRNRSKAIQLEKTLQILTSGAMVDAFQHAVYERNITSGDELAALWLELNRRFVPDVLDITGYEEIVSRQWQRILHFFKVPLYYIEYCIAQIGALGIWKNSLAEPEKALDAYWRALTAGGSKPLPELFELANVKFGMDKTAIEPLAELVRRHIDLCTP